MELLDALREVRVLGVSRQHRRLVQLFATVLDPVHLDPDLNSSFLKVRVGPNAHRLRGSNLT